MTKIREQAMTMMERLTETEQKIYAVLSDGYMHSAKELKAAWDTHAEDSALWFHISNIRRKIRPFGQGLAMDEGYYQIVAINRKE